MNFSSRSLHSDDLQSSRQGIVLVADIPTRRYLHEESNPLSAWRVEFSLGSLGSPQAGADPQV